MPRAGMMDPSVLCMHLRRVASDLDAAGPSGVAAARDEIRKVLVALQGERVEAEARRIAAYIVRLAAEEVDVSMWDTDEGKDVDFAFGEAHREDRADKLEPKLKLLQSKIDRFVKELMRPAGEVKPDEDDSEVFTSAPK